MLRDGDHERHRSASVRAVAARRRRGSRPASAGGDVSALIESLELGEYVPMRPVIDFMLPTPSGGRVSARDFHGKALLIHFWTTWCQPCKKGRA